MSEGSRDFLSKDFYADEDKAVKALLKAIDWGDDRAERVRENAISLVQSIRAKPRGTGQLESFMQQYALDTQEGLALMSLAEALLRIPDAATASVLIKDKVAAANWLKGLGNSGDWVVKAAGVGLLMTGRTLDSALSRVGEPVIREAMVQAMRMMGKQFVLGRDIEEAMANAQSLERKGYRMSYDMLGEGARTQADADKYFAQYSAAIKATAQQKTKERTRKPGISVKLSALHPRYDLLRREECVPALSERLHALCEQAAAQDISLTVDAEEADRLALSLEIILPMMEAFPSWQGFGLAVQAYQKRAPALVDYLIEEARARDHNLQIRLVKGAYWDSEIKKAQLLGVKDFPVFTRKHTTDVSYLLCAQKMLQASDAVYSMFGTHNAHTVAAIIDMAKEKEASYEFQRLFGMGAALYDTVLDNEGTQVSIYAPVGPHADLLAYLVRRLLENGANSSFVNQLLDKSIPPEELATDPVQHIRALKDVRHSQIARPPVLYQSETPPRLNSAGVNLRDEKTLSALQTAITAHKENNAYEAAPLIGGKVYHDTVAEDVHNPALYGEVIGRCWPGNKGLAGKAVRVAGEAFESWRCKPPEERAQVLERWAELMEKHGEELMALCVHEAGKTMPDALAELREAVDFCRYYAARGRLDCADQVLSGPTGECNIFRLEGRGVFVCISPWNFPMAIFSGQIAAALMAGNTVVAKPAEQTPLIAQRLVELAHQAGVPHGVLNLLPGDGTVGAALVAQAGIAGVAFTGSTDVAREINRQLAARPGEIVPLIAETGGLNAMIVDSTALPEQVIDDVILSAFGSAGQRCSALRLLCVQDDIADTIIRMLQGAMATIQVGVPGDPATDVGPVIDEEALAALKKHRTSLGGFGKLIYEVPLEAELARDGFFFGPCAFEIEQVADLKREVFGPVLHVVRYKCGGLDDLVEEINATGYGLTFGLHSRIEKRQSDIAQKIRAGNIYVNRGMTGAIVGCQAFGGRGLSGTGPKAGGPHYLHGFATEKVVSTDTTAAGGNASLVSMEE